MALEAPQGERQRTTAAPPPEETTRSRLQYLILGRLVVATLLLGGSFVLTGASASGTSAALLWLIVATYGASLLFAFVLPSTGRVIPWAALQLAWDLVLVSGLVYLFGGATSGFTFLYGLSIVAAALILGPRSAQGVTVAAILLYLLVGLALSYGWLPAPDALPPFSPLAPPDPREVGLSLLRNLIGLVVIGVLSVALAARLRAAGGRLQAAEASAAGFAKLTEDILRSLASGLLTTDLAGHIQAINPAGAEILGASPEALLGRPFDGHFPVPPAAGDEGRQDLRHEGEGTRADGSRFPVGFSLTPLRDAEDTVLGRLVLFTDLTELSELRRTAERAQRLAALGRLAAGLAHEIRNPLGSIRGSVEMVREARELDAEDRRLLALVLTEVDRLNDLVTTMLDVGRPKDPERVGVNLGQLAAEVVSVARGRGGPKVELHGVEAPVRAYADPAQLRQVLWNLLKNALQFADSSVQVTIGWSHEGQAEITVEDDGPGLPAGDAEQLFDMFYSRRRHGVGLGLALVKQIVEAHGGAVRAESVPGGGARFRVSLPPAASSRPDVPLTGAPQA